MSILAIVLIAVVVAAVIALLLLPGQGPLSGFSRSADQRNKVGGMANPIGFGDEFKRPRDEGGH